MRPPNIKIGKRGKGKEEGKKIEWPSSLLPMIEYARAWIMYLIVPRVGQMGSGH